MSKSSSSTEDGPSLELFVHLDSSNSSEVCCIAEGSNVSFTVPSSIAKEFPYKSRKFEFSSVLSNQSLSSLSSNTTRTIWDSIQQSKNVVSFSFGNSNTSRDTLHFDGSSGVLSSLLPRISSAYPDASISLFGLRNSIIVDLLASQDAPVFLSNAFSIYRMKLQLDVPKYKVSDLIKQPLRLVGADQKYRQIPDCASFHRVAFLELGSDGETILLVDVVSTEWMSRKSLLTLGERDFSLLQKSLSCFGDVMNAVAMHRLRVPNHRADVTALMQLVAVRSSYCVLVGCHVDISARNAEEAFFALQFASRIIGLKGATIQPFARDPRIEKAVLARDMHRLEAEVALALATTGVSKLSSTEIADVEATIAQRKAKLEQDKKTKEAETQHYIDSHVEKLAKETMSSLRSEILHLQHDLNDATTAVSMLQVKLASDDPKQFEQRVAMLKTQLEKTLEESENERKKIGEHQASLAEKKEHLVVLQKKRDSAQDEIRAAMNYRVESYAAIRASREDQRKQWEQQRATWRSQVLSSKGVAEKDPEPEYAVLREPLTKDMLVSLKKTFETIKAGVDDREVSMNSLTDEEKALTIALRHMEQHPVDWSVEDWDKLRAKEENLLRNAEMQDRKLKDLVDKVLLFLQHGTALVKFRPFSKPGRKHFFLSPDCKELCFCDIKDWDAAMTVGPGKERDRCISRSVKSIVLDEVRLFVLGQYSPVFAKSGVSFGSTDFYRSFSLYYGKSKQTLDVVAESDTDFEAWLIGLSSLVRVQPKWGSGIDVSHEPCFYELADDEVELCQSCHISPYFYKEAKLSVLEHFRTKGFVTKYDMRIVTGMDVLRCVKMHDLLESRGDISSRPTTRLVMPGTPTKASEPPTLTTKLSDIHIPHSP